MKSSRSLIDHRREQLLKLIKDSGSVSVNEIAEKFHLSLLTVRRDLQYLEDHKLLERFYGGAKYGNDIKTGTAEDEGKPLLAREKIANYAASLICDNEVIFINTSETALNIIKYISAKNVTVITNNGNVIGEENPSGAKIILLGGEIRAVKGALVGSFTMNNLKHITANKSFIGCCGVDIHVGVTTEIMNEVKINEMMHANVYCTSYILADHTKMGKVSSYVSCEINQVNNIITDAGTDPHMVEQLKAIGVEVAIV